MPQRKRTNPCVLPPNMVHVAAPPHAQVASSGVGAGYPHYPFQAAYNFPYPPTCVQSFINPYTSKSIAGLPPQHLSAPLQYNQPSFPSESFAAFPPPYQHHGSELAMGFTSSSLPQVTVSLAPASQKRVGEDCEGYRPRKRAKLYDISRDMEFVSFLFIL
ncbi:uncharacterized protein EDB91DRAFT_577751 [Suillus paluster]|uniref:uncharacterized protein n=1 Tax=Suillus paluster TaxID=48578 RepID=UPI001B871639|nr:uncharacterized protein EDB91DRAFT_577751 [Suillus paluster]KAG1734944.1 hypothetical protein EDB91DRAFT_577751 [Suillus paluster]